MKYIFQIFNTFNIVITCIIILNKFIILIIMIKLKTIMFETNQFSTIGVLEQKRVSLMNHLQMKE